MSTSISKFVCPICRELVEWDALEQHGAPGDATYPLCADAPWQTDPHFREDAEAVLLRGEKRRVPWQVMALNIEP
jgi:hypothetical protein